MNCRLEQTKCKYTGEPVIPKMYVADLEEGTEYTVEYKNNIEIGTKAEATATGIGNYIGSKTLYFEISDMSIADLNPRLSITEYVYDGVEKRPEVYFDSYLVLDQDYTLTYEDNLNAGTGRVIINGINTYSNSVTLTFKIERKKLSYRTIELSQTEYFYNGLEQKPTFELEGLIPGVDYNTIYSNNKDIGTAKITVEGINNYIGTLYTTFEIKYNLIENCVAKYGTASVKTIYRIDGPLKMYASEENYKNGIAMVENQDYIVISESRTQYLEFILVSDTIKGIGGFSSEYTFNFRVIESEPDTPIDYVDDGLYNFGDIDEKDESAVGMYDFTDIDEGTDPENIADGDYDFDAMSGMYLDGYDEDDGSNIDKDGDNTDNPADDKYPDDGTYNFGDLSLNDETAVGDYDFGDLDEGIDKDTVVIDGKDYDFNKFASDSEYDFITGDIYILNNFDIYAGHHSIESSFKYTGLVYIYNNRDKNKRIRVSRIEDAVDSPARVFGWVSCVDLLSLSIINVGEPVIVTGNLYSNADGTGSYISKYESLMYVSEYKDTEGLSCPYGLSNSKLGAIIGYASIDDIKRESESV